MKKQYLPLLYPIYPNSRWTLKITKTLDGLQQLITTPSTSVQFRVWRFYWNFSEYTTYKVRCSRWYIWKSVALIVVSRLYQKFEGKFKITSPLQTNFRILYLSWRFLMSYPFMQDYHFKNPRNSILNSQTKGLLSCSCPLHKLPNILF